MVPCSVVSGSNLYSQVGEEWSGVLKDELMLFGNAWCDEEKTQHEDRVVNIVVDLCSYSHLWPDAVGSDG